MWGICKGGLFGRLVHGQLDSARSRGSMKWLEGFMCWVGGLIRWPRLAAPSGLPALRLEAPSLSETGSVAAAGIKVYGGWEFRTHGLEVLT